MKFYALFLTVAVIAGSTFAQESTVAPTTGSAAEVTTVSATASPAEVTTVSATASPAEVTTVSATASPGEETTVSATASPGEVSTASDTASTDDTTTDSPDNGSTTAPSSAKPPANSLQCYACDGDDCDEKVIINCADNEAGANGYACYSIQISDNGTQKPKLGCIGISDSLTACQAVRQELQISADDTGDECTACQTDLCNSSGVAQLSMAALLGILLAKYFI